jgi:hypothetical protein
MKLIITKGSLKHKALKDLSTNPNTMKARRQIEAAELEPIKGQIKKVESTEEAAIMYTKRSCKFPSYTGCKRADSSIARRESN